MTDDSSYGSTHGGGGRDLAEIDLEFATLRRFREEMAPFLNYNGFFVRTDEPFPRGTPVKFRFLLPEGFALAEGTGVVAWARTKETHKREDPGMAVWFEEVNRQSKEVVDELVDFHIATGGKAFELGGPPGAAAGDIPTDALGGAAPDDDIPMPPPPDDAPTTPAPPASSESFDFDSLPEPEPPPSARPSLGKREEGVLPDWLSRAEEKKPSEIEAPPEVPPAEPPRDVSRDTIRMETIPPDSKSPDTSGLEAAIRDMPMSMQDDLDISLMPEDDEGATVGRGAPDEPEVRMSKAPKNRFGGIGDALRDVRLMPLLAVTLILVACFAGVYWVLTRPAREPIEPIRTVLDDQSEAAAAAGAQEPAVELGAAEQSAEGGAAAGAEPAAGGAGGEGEVDFEITGEGPPASEGDEMIPEELPPAVDGTATRLIDVASFLIEDTTQVAVRGNGTFLKERVQVTRLENPARVWIRIKNIGTFYRPNFISVDSPDVKMVRVGHHPEENPPSIYVVLDLANDRARVEETWLDGDTFRVAIDSR